MPSRLATAVAMMLTSRATGSLLVRPHAGIRTVGYLRGKRLGVADGGLVKSSLLRAYTRSRSEQRKSGAGARC